MIKILPTITGLRNGVQLVSSSNVARAVISSWNVHTYHFRRNAYVVSQSGAVVDAQTGSVSKVVTSGTRALVTARNVCTISAAANAGRRTIVDGLTCVIDFHVTGRAGTRVVAVAVICAHFGALCAVVVAGILGKTVGVVAGIFHEPRVAGARVATSQVRVAGDVYVCAGLVLTANAWRLKTLVDISTCVAVRLHSHKAIGTGAGVVVAHRTVHFTDFTELTTVVCRCARIIG